MQTVPMRDLIAPLASPVYRLLWIASVVSNLGTLMQAVAVAWVMTSLSTSPLVVSLVPVCTLAPVFFFGIAGGALADMVSRRKFLIATQLWMMICATAMGALVMAGLATPTRLLALTFALGMGNALNLPAWQSLVQDIVPRGHVASAVALNSISFNTGRVLGPVLGGLLVGSVGASPVFFINAASFLGTVLVLATWQGIAPTAHGNGFWRVVTDGLGYVRRAAHLHSPLVRLSLFAFLSSAPPALLPLLARERLTLQASQYGMLLGFFGLGSLLGGAFVPALRRSIGASTTVTTGAGLMGLALVALAAAGSFAAAAAALFAGGCAWVSSMVNLNLAVQMSVPATVRGRIMSVHLTIFQGGFALGSLAAGWIAKHSGVPAALEMFGAGLVILAAATIRQGLPETSVAPHEITKHSA
ncbi:MAG: hypothetical protein RIQ71_1833 [Verrucomicrobiota bacterium]|jgi:MFS family permease